MSSDLTVANSSCLIALSAIRRLELLRDVFGQIVIPSAVAAETELADSVWLRVVPVQNQTLVKSLQLELGAGEAEAIALGTEQVAARIILDDKKARRIANELGLCITGTVAVLVRAKQLGAIGSVSKCIEQLAAVGFHLSPQLIEEARRLSSE